jgi:hypothetical protein
MALSWNEIKERALKFRISSEASRMEFLFELYEKYTADLFTKEKVKKGRK